MTPPIQKKTCVYSCEIRGLSNSLVKYNVLYPDLYSEFVNIIVVTYLHFNVTYLHDLIFYLKTAIIIFCSLVL